MTRTFLALSALVTTSAFAGVTSMPDRDLGPDTVQSVAHAETVETAPADTLPVYEGYEQDWQQANDDMIIRVVNDFNDEMGWAPGHPDHLDPALVKAWALQESGSHQEIFTSGDMMQMNNSGDWAPEKVYVGVEKGERLDPEESLRTALEWAYQKGEETRQGSPDGDWTVAIRDGEPVDGYVSRFTNWERAITRYNGGGVPDYYGDITRRMSDVA